MKYRIANLLATLALSACATTRLATPSLQDAAVPADTIQIMFLGTYHFENPGLDLVNPVADDVLTPQRQAELADLSTRLSAFHPTAIVVETRRRGPDLLDPGYAAFKVEDLATDRNEITQVGYRLAHDTGISRVYGVDETEGELEYFPFERVQAFVERNGPAGFLDEKIAEIQAEAAETSKDQIATPIATLIARQNDPDTIHRMHANFYYGLLPLNEAADHSGAALNYGWYARNAVIFSNIAEAAKPGDRIVVLYGSGHAYWLRHFAQETPGFALVEANDYLLP